MTSRRDFLGGMIGGAIAGPSFAREAALQPMGLKIPNGTASFGQLTQGSGRNLMSEADYAGSLRERLSRLRKMTREDRREAYNFQRRESDIADLEALRSVSPRHRLHMLNERQVERAHQSEIIGVLRELFRIGEGE